ncbi:DUF2294 domain-containing protein [Halobacillus yeomjeoni]|uniref:DUF2294 domain-containing protein n=1 Tax=Halobacillus yeomjeoni TaxID=311194 RepID=UPI001CD80A15|nr:Na-translocating system protein MpsC family protein [Halobacillus yeomjeoni]MCA0985459.1 DUF2294 domain-containing protein [Halobacillus yeomjeoni]
MDKRSIQSEMSSYIGKLFRDNFGKGPSSVFVSLEEPYVTIYMKDFLAPIERVLVGQKKEDKVEETRDLLMSELIPDIKATFRAAAGIELADLYYDWSLSNRTGVMIGVLASDNTIDEETKAYSKREELHEEVDRVSLQAEKSPEEITSYLLNERTLLVERIGILVAIEKEMIRLGFKEHLKISKRHLEKRLLSLASFEQILGKRVEDIFVDWDFAKDRSYILFILKPEK